MDRICVDGSGGGRGRRGGLLGALAAGLLAAAAATAPAGAAGLAGPASSPPAPGIADLGPPMAAPGAVGSRVDLGGLIGDGAAATLLGHGPDLALLGAAPGLGLDALAPRGPIHEAAVTLPPIVSGLPWRSGISCTSAELEAFRGRRTDAQVQFLWHDTWDMMLARVRDNYYRRQVRRTPLPVISMPMFPRTEFKAHARCAAGEFDNYYRQLGAALVEIGAGHAILRPGWEPNVGSGSHPWGIDSVSEAPAYVACFRRLVTTFRTVRGSSFKFEWSNAKASSLPGNVLSTYPGDAFVDVVGLHYYAIDTQFSTQRKWDRFVNSTRLGGPQGIGSWIRHAASIGKPFAVPEWGVWARNGTFEAADTPIYIDNMYRFFRANAPLIAYENYSNCQEAHRIGPRTPFPNSSSRYAELWRAGQ
jgi:hypothetical protein